MVLWSEVVHGLCCVVLAKFSLLASAYVHVAHKILLGILALGKCD